MCVRRHFKHEPDNGFIRSMDPLVVFLQDVICGNKGSPLVAINKWMPAADPMESDRSFAIHIPRPVHPVDNIIECRRVPQSGLPAKVPDDIVMNTDDLTDTQYGALHTRVLFPRNV